MKCNVCKRETTPIRVTGQDYCSECGNLYVAPARRVSMDLSPRRPTPSQRTTPKPAASATPPATPITAAQAKIDKPTKRVAATTPPKPATHERHVAHLSDRLENAKRVSRSPHINKFANSQGHLAIQTSREQDAQPSPELPNITATQHEAMTKLPRQAPPTPPSPSPKTSQPASKANYRPHLGLSPQANRIMATTAAIAIMAGYIWLHNYPKLALQSASNKAGLAASLPGYMPSSYSLAHTGTAPGLVTLKFTSPSVNEPLKIAQARTNWDSSSLLDNFVAKNTDDYTTVQGQGLTIYLFGHDKATWVNHGVHYSIEGASRLSREQILKIAYSL